MLNTAETVKLPVLILLVDDIIRSLAYLVFILCLCPSTMFAQSQYQATEYYSLQILNTSYLTL
jgi:hypothetical protein